MSNRVAPGSARSTEEDASLEEVTHEKEMADDGPSVKEAQRATLGQRWRGLSRGKKCLAVLCTVFCIVVIIAAIVIGVLFWEAGNLEFTVVSGKPALSTRAGGHGALHTNSFTATRWSSGQNTVDQLEEMQYYITRIEGCNSIETMGSAYNNPKGCFTLYAQSGDDSVEFYEAYGASKARADTTNYVNLMDPQAIKKLARNVVVRQKDVGLEINYGIINWMRPVKVKASVTVADFAGATGTIYSKEGSGGDGPINSPGATIASSDMSEGPAELATVSLPNGGTWFKFLKPMTLQQGAMKLDLAFDPSGIIIADALPPAGPESNMLNNLRDAHNHGMQVPMLAMSPIPHHPSEKIYKEVYESDFYSAGIPFPLTPGDPPNQNKFRVTLYGTESNVLAVDTWPIILPGSSQTTMIQRPFFVSESGNTLAFQNFENGSILTEFTRKAIVGETTTAKLPCKPASSVQGPNGPAACTTEAHGDQMTLGFTLVYRDLLPA